jgi:membrane protein YqaA with SNARE-associated domain
MALQATWQKHRLNLARLFALIAVIAITWFIFTLSEEQITQIESWGFLGIGILTFLSNATVLIPAPGLAVVFIMGAKFNPLLVGLAAGIGGTLGELSGYLAGFSGQAVIENTKIYERMVTWMKKYGAWTILFMGIIPNPVFDVAGVTAGALKMKIWKFLLFAGIGITIKMTLMAMMGAGIFNIPFLEQFL